MKLWIDDTRPAPVGYIWAKSVDETKDIIKFAEMMYAKRSKVFYNCEQFKITLLDIDHDAGDYARFGGDYIRLLDWLEETGRNYPIHIHSMNVVGRMNMEAICKRNNWVIID